MTLAPIILFVYNRPWHTQQTLEALQKNELASESELFIYSDAPKSYDAKESVAEVRALIKNVIGFKKVSIIERDKNWGLAASIIDGVTAIINQYDKIIVLEDDLVTSPYFLRYMNDALEFYKDEEKVWHISGYCPPLNKVIKEHFFINPTSCWGWATWDKKWSFFKKDSEFFLKWFNNKRRKCFNVNNSYNYYSHLELNHHNKLNTWAIFWYATVYFNNGLSLHPKKSFVRNIGHDNSGIHCGESDNFNVDLAYKYQKYFSEKITIDTGCNKALEIYYKRLRKPFYRKLILKIKNILTRIV